MIGCDTATLAATLAGTRLRPPCCAINVTGALFHRQGGLDIDVQCRVRRDDGRPLPNLLAAGGAARGASGNAVWGYLSGNYLLSAVAGGFISAHASTRLLAGETRRTICRLWPDGRSNPASCSPPVCTAP